MAAAALSLLATTSAHAAPAFHCEASPLRATIAGTQTVEPVVQGRNGDCATGEALPSVALPPLLNASALTARTVADPTAGQGFATGAIAGLQVLPTSAVLDQVLAPINQAIDALPLQPITLPNPLPGLPGLPTITGVTLDIKSAVRALLPTTFPALLSADVLQANASVGCAAGAPALAGSSTIAGVKLLGQDVGLDSVLTTALPLLNGQSISLADLDLSKVQVFDGLGLTPITGVALTPVIAAIKPLLAALPPIPLPPSELLSFTLTPNEQLADANSLTQRALHASISLLGRPILDAVLGEAKVAAAAGTCAPPAPAAPAAKPAAKGAVAGQSVADQLLACSDRKLILVDVLKQDGHVKLLGAANRSYVGKQVAIRLRATGKVVAHAKVRKDGSFQTTAPIPARAYFASHAKANSVRYRAEIGKELSLPLKLQRRLIVSSLTSKKGKVTIAGRVVRPLTTPVATIRLVRRVSCHKVVLVKRFKPRADGTFNVTVKAPAGQAAAVYRLATSVREKPSNPRSYPTFTLPRGVALDTR
ncbi:hypothetical protein [Baekduia sp.]|uniref:hypothetical protein n=1 Tax=Baekduia sp. TaxID=2600305 RepID=UPI002E0A9C22|nr:hypothetical protein [Baekduia sp.]